MTTVLRLLSTQKKSPGLSLRPKKAVTNGSLKTPMKYILFGKIDLEICDMKTSDGLTKLNRIGLLTQNTMIIMERDK